MQLTNTIDAPVISNSMDGVQLPPLPIDDIEKLDYLLSCMKEKQTEFVNVYSVCKDKWGDNKLLYLYFAEYLKKNYFTTVQNHRNTPEYAWQQMIAPRGLLMAGFKREYMRQREVKNKNAQSISWYKFITSFLVHYLIPFSILIAF